MSVKRTYSVRYSPGSSGAKSCRCSKRTCAGKGDTWSRPAPARSALAGAGAGTGADVDVDADGSSRSRVDYAQGRGHLSIADEVAQSGVCYSAMRSRVPVRKKSWTQGIRQKIGTRTSNITGKRESATMPKKATTGI